MKKYELKDEDNVTLLVEKGLDMPNTAFVVTGKNLEENDDADGVYVRHDKAPDVALAVLEASGWDIESAPVLALREAVKEIARVKAEAEDAAKLKEEAKALEEAFYAMKITRYGSEAWERLALKARELYGKGA